MITLVVPFGAETAPISHGAENFRPYLAEYLNPRSLWLVDVPEEAAIHFLHTGGFSLYQHAMRRALSGATIPLIHLDGATSFSWEGVEYVADEKGIFTVPAEAFNDLSPAHGFRIHAESDVLVQMPEEQEQGDQADKPAKGKRGARRAAEQGKDGGLPPFEPDPPGTPHPDVPMGPA